MWYVIYSAIRIEYILQYTTCFDNDIESAHRFNLYLRLLSYIQYKNKGEEEKMKKTKT